jgi:hypothetical protein
MEEPSGGHAHRSPSYDELYRDFRSDIPARAIQDFVKVQPAAHQYPRFAGTHNHRRQFVCESLIVLPFSNNIGCGVWVPTFAGTM